RGGGADRLDAAARIVGGQAARRRVGRSDAEPRILVPVVAPGDARTDRENPVVAVSRDVVGAGHPDPALVTGDSLADLSAQTEADGQIERDEGAGLEAELDLGQLGADVLRGADALEIGDRAEPERARFEKREAEAVIRAFEAER